jgi:antitoxin (DNA-binding transcriptional repressor) of toxin-antitoxin stability system
MYKDNLITVKELREDLPTIINKVRRGGEFLVLKKSKPVFRLSSPEAEDSWETVIDFTKIKKGGVKISELLKAI